MEATYPIPDSELKDRENSVDAADPDNLSASMEIDSESLNH